MTATTDACVTQAIVTRYKGPTNRRGARIIATAWAGRIVFPYEHDLGSISHRAAAMALAAKLGRNLAGWIQGCMPDGASYVFVRRNPAQGED